MDIPVALLAAGGLAPTGVPVGHLPIAVSALVLRWTLSAVRIPALEVRPRRAGPPSPEPAR